MEKKVTPLKVQLWNHMNLSQSSTAGEGVNYTDIMKVIDKHSFQTCYEKALLKDEKLSVKLVFLLKISQSKVQNTRLELACHRRFKKPQSAFPLSFLCEQKFNVFEQ